MDAPQVPQDRPAWGGRGKVTPLDFGSGVLARLPALASHVVTGSRRGNLRCLARAHLRVPAPSEHSTPPTPQPRTIVPKAKMSHFCK